MTREPTMVAEGFRSVLGAFCSGVTVVTAMSEDGPAGMTCQSFFSLSLDPPLIAFSPAKTSKTYPSIRRSGAFCINILADDQAIVCGAFARSGGDKWTDIGWRHGVSGSPILDGVLAWIDCKFETEYDSGDHFLTVGRVMALDAVDKRPLIYFRGAFESLQDRGLERAQASA